MLLFLHTLAVRLDLARTLLSARRILVVYKESIFSFTEDISAEVIKLFLVILCFDKQP